MTATPAGSNNQIAMSVNDDGSSVYSYLNFGLQGSTGATLNILGNLTGASGAFLVSSSANSNNVYYSNALTVSNSIDNTNVYINKNNTKYSKRKIQKHN